MQEVAQGIVELLEKGDQNWSSVLKEELAKEQDGNELFLNVLKIALEKEMPFQAIEELVCFWERKRYKFGLTRWLDSLPLCKNEDTFEYLLYHYLDFEPSFVHGLESVFRLGLEKNCLPRIIKHLERLFGLFDDYLLDMGNEYQELPPMEEQVARVVLQVLDCPLDALPEAKSVLLQNWLLSLREDV